MIKNNVERGLPFVANNQQVQSPEHNDEEIQGGVHLLYREITFPTMQLFVVLPLHGIQFCPNTYNKEEIFPRDSPFVTTY